MEHATLYTKQAWLAWEKLRIVYNLVLLIVGLPCLWLLMLLANFVGQGDYYAFGFFSNGTVLFGVAANAFYCLGPLADVCVYSFVDIRMGRARYFLFAAGLLLSMGLELALLRRLLYHLAGYLQ
jgi:hypothetical protein